MTIQNSEDEAEMMARRKSKDDRCHSPLSSATAENPAGAGANRIFLHLHVHVHNPCIYIYTYNIYIYSMNVYECDIRFLHKGHK